MIQVVQITHSRLKKTSPDEPDVNSLLVIPVVLTLYVFYLQACKGEDLGKVEFDEEIKKRFKMVYVPNWFSVDLKTGVSHKSDTGAFHLSQQLHTQKSFLSLVSGLIVLCLFLDRC